MSALKEEFEALGEKYGLDPEAIKESLEKAQQDAEAEKHRPTVEVTRTSLKIRADWADCEVFKRSDKGNYILASAYWVKTKVKGPHGGLITVNLVAVESDPDAKK